MESNILRPMIIFCSKVDIGAKSQDEVNVEKIILNKGQGYLIIWRATILKNYPNFQHDITHP